MSAVLERKPVKAKRCKVCRDSFTPARPLQAACSIPCATEIARAKREQQERKEQRAKARAAREDKRETRKRLAAMKTLPQLLKEAQREFNRAIRYRDAGGLCISCGSLLPVEAVGGGFDCGHYRSVGSAPHLRFHEQNAHGQCKHCNRYGAGRAVDYRIGLVARIGLQGVEALEANNEVHHWTRDEVIAIRDTYRKKANELEKA